MLAPFASPAFLAALAITQPCHLLERTEIAAILHWHVTAVRESTYRLPQARGSLCRFDATEGTVLVTVPDSGTSFFNNNDLVDPFANGMGTRVAGLGASVRMFDNTAYVGKRGRTISIAVLPTQGAADGPSLARLAKIAARRMR